jgi:5-formyltetrahydrofolate cyclo-ligase
MSQSFAAAPKDFIRQHFTAVRSSLSLDQRTAAEEVILAALFESEAWRRATVVCAYLPIRGELNTLPILDRARVDGKPCALPVTLTAAAEGKMVFRRLSGQTPKELPIGRFGIPEPPDSHPNLSRNELAGALILVPGLVFDDEGFRVGYGGGYYDRMLAELKTAGIPHTAAGLCYAVCRTPTLPREPHDIPVDLILDERRITYPHGNERHHRKETLSVPLHAQATGVSAG